MIAWEDAVRGKRRAREEIMGYETWLQTNRLRDSRAAREKYLAYRERKMGPKKYKALANPMSTGATVALVAVAGAAVVGGYFLYKQSANTGGKSTASNPTNYPLTPADFMANKQITAKAGDTVTVTVLSGETLSATGGVSGSGTSYTVNSSGTLAMTQQVPVPGNPTVPIGTVTFTV